MTKPGDLDPAAFQPEAAAGAGQPAWVTPELPPAYADLASRIAALREDARKFEDIAGVLWQTGPALALSVCRLFSALGFQAERTAADANYDVRVQLDGDRRLLVEVTGGTEAVPKKSPSITRLLRALQDDVWEHDRLVVAVNAFCDRPLDAREDPVSTDALRLFQRLGANVVTTATLFGIWKYSLVDLDAARKSITRLHGQDGGVFR